MKGIGASCICQNEFKNSDVMFRIRSFALKISLWLQHSMKGTVWKSLDLMDL